jgi:hypothetical protein
MVSSPRHLFILPENSRLAVSALRRIVNRLDRDGRRGRLVVK